MNDNKNQPVKKTRNTVKRENPFDGFNRISFSIKSSNKRQHITLEPEYIAALDKIAPEKRSQWLSQTVDTYIEEHGIESTTRIIKIAIVVTLIQKINHMERIRDYKLENDEYEDFLSRLKQEEVCDEQL